MQTRTPNVGILFSASQITLYRECARKWAWRYLAGIKTPQHPSAALGDEVDSGQLQPYLRDGRPLNFTRPSGEIAAMALAYLPEPKTPGMVVQKSFLIPSPTWIEQDGKREHIGFWIQGYMDLWLPDSARVPGMPGGAPFVGDFKTTGDLKWAKTEEILRTDVQAMTYATAALFETRAEHVDLAWMYLQTRGTRKSKRIHIRVNGDHVAEQFSKINATAIEMLGARKANPSPLDLPPSPDQCEAYGGCPYRDRCFGHMSPSQYVDAFEAQATREGLAAFGAAAEVRSEPGMSNLLEQLRAKKAAALAAAGAASTQAASPPAPTQAPPPAEALPEWATAPTDPMKQKAVGINPPESALPPAPPVGAATAPAETTKPKRGRPPKPAPDPTGADAAAFASPPLPTVVAVGDADTTVRLAKAIKAAADAFLSAMGAA